MSYAILKNIHYRISVTFLYGVTLFVLWHGLAPFLSLDRSEASYQSTLMHMPVEVTEKATSPVEKVVISGTPVLLRVTRLDIEKEILAGIYDKSSGTWNVSPKGIHFAQPSKPANDFAGNTLIYGHNNRSVFASLKKLKAGDEAEIVSDNGYSFKYIFSESKNYEPDDTSIFSYQGPPLLTLQTCSGYFNEIRTLYKFRFDSVVKL